MRVTFSGKSRAARTCLGMIAVLFWACGAAPTWAGDGESIGSVQTLLGDKDGTSGLCHLLAINPCPQLPTLTQLILQFSALVNSPPDLIRSPQGTGLIGGTGLCTVPGNQGLQSCAMLAINAVNPPVPAASLPQAPSTSPPDLSPLVPLAFLGPTTGSGQAIPVPAGARANSFFYAVATTANGEPGQPDSLTLTYDYLPLTSTTFFKGQQVAAISLPLVFLDTASGTEQSVTTILQISAACTGGTSCLVATAVGNFSGNGTQKRSPSDLGLKWQLVFGTSPDSPSSAHAIFQVQAPLVVTSAHDAAYFGKVPFGGVTLAGTLTGVNQLSGLPTAFTTDDSGFPTAFLKGVNDGVAPYAAPTTVTQATTSTYGFCASFWGGSVTSLNPAVAAFLSIATDGTAYVSSPASPPATVTCPF